MALQQSTMSRRVSKRRAMKGSLNERFKWNKGDFYTKVIDEDIGRGVFTATKFLKGAFLMTYEGRLTDSEPETENDAYIFEFSAGGKRLWIDATLDDGSFGRLINDCHKSPNCVPKAITLAGTAGIGFFAVKDIPVGEELRYCYGGQNYPWRTKKSSLKIPDKFQDVGLEDLSFCGLLKESSKSAQKTLVPSSHLPDIETPYSQTPCPKQLPDAETLDSQAPDVEPCSKQLPDAETLDSQTPDVEPCSKQLPDAETLDSQTPCPKQLPGVETLDSQTPVEPCSKQLPDVETLDSQKPDVEPCSKQLPGVETLDSQTPVEPCSKQLPGVETLDSQTPDVEPCSKQLPDAETLDSQTPDVEPCSKQLPDVETLDRQTPDVEPCSKQLPDVETLDSQTPCPKQLPGVETLDSQTPVEPCSKQLPDEETLDSQKPDVEPCSKQLPGVETLDSQTPVEPCSKQLPDVETLDSQTPRIEPCSKQLPDAETLDRQTPDVEPCSKQLPDAETLDRETPDVEPCSKQLPDVETLDRQTPGVEPCSKQLLGEETLDSQTPDVEPCSKQLPDAETLDRQTPDVEPCSKQLPDVETLDSQTPDVEPCSKQLLGEETLDSQTPDVEPCSKQLPDAETLDRQTPDVEPCSKQLPDAETLDSQTPDVEPCSKQLPDAETLDRQTPDVEPCSKQLPDAETLDSQTPDVEPCSKQLPDAETLDSQTPDVEPCSKQLPDAETLDRQTPDVEPCSKQLPDVETLDRQTPDVEPCSKQLPDVETLDSQTPDVEPFSKQLPDAETLDRQTPDVEPCSKQLLGEETLDSQTPDVEPSSKQLPDVETLDSQTPDLEPLSKHQTDAACVFKDSFSGGAYNGVPHLIAQDPLLCEGNVESDDDASLFDSGSDYDPPDHVSDSEDSVHSDVYPPQALPALKGQDGARNPAISKPTDPTVRCVKRSKTKKKCQKVQDATVGSTVTTNSEVQQSAVRVMSTNKEQRYDKKFFCLYCEKPQAKIPRHLLAAHKDEDHVKTYLSLTDACEKKTLMTKLRNWGNHIHNTKVLKAQEGVLIVTYRPDTDGFVTPDSYVPCQYCLGYYVSWDLWKHTNRCASAPKDRKKHARVVSTSRLLLPTSRKTTSGLKSLLSTMKNDDIGMILKNDPLILQLGEKMFLKNGHDREQFNFIRNTLREIARLLKNLREQSELPNSSLAEFIAPTKFQQVLEAARSVAGFSAESHLFSTPSLALKLGHTVRKCAKIMEGKALQTGDEEKADRALKFNKLCELCWTEEISTHALRTLSEQQRNKVKLVPLVKDVKILTDYLRKTGMEAYRSLSQKGDDVAAWTILNETALTQVIQFNRRRQGEVSKARIADYTNKHTTAPEDLNTVLSPLEQKLCNTFKRIEIVGKRGRTVPMIITPDVKSWIDLLLATRQAVGVAEGNTFLFPRCNYGSLSHIRGCDTLRYASETCGAKYPQLLRSTKLRKQLGTLSQVLNLRDNELDILANFLGHDIRVHRDFYRLPEETIQVAKVSKLLLNMENGKFPEQHGKTLDEITVDSDEELDVLIADCPEDDGSETEEPVQDAPALEASSSRDIDVDEPSEPASKKRRPWTEEEKAAVFRHFEGSIFIGKIPGKKEADKCLLKEHCLRKRTWRNIKDFVRNQIKTKKSRTC